MFRAAALVPLLLLLTGCDWFKSEPPASETGGQAEGELLEGSISDAMIYNDQLRSESPRAAPEPGEDGADPGEEAAEDGDEAAEATGAGPSAEPTAEPAEPADE